MTGTVKDSQGNPVAGAVVRIELENCGAGGVCTLTVGGGGTGLTSLTAHNLYAGNGAPNPNPVAAGNSGQVLISNGAGADPTFQDPIVSGPDATGAAPSKSPVQVGALDNSTGCSSGPCVRSWRRTGA